MSTHRRKPNVRKSDASFEDTVMDAIRALPEKQLRQFLKRVEADPTGAFLTDVLQHALTTSISATVPAVVQLLEMATPDLLKSRRKIRRGFQRRLRTYWGAALDRLEVIVHAFWEYGVAFIDEATEDPSLLDDPTFTALVRLQARASRVALEIWTLLRSGLPDGAQARWRTLHEIAVTAQVLTDHHPDAAHRYLAHEELREIRRAELAHHHGAYAPDQALSEGEVAELAAMRQELEAEFGDGFASDYGWAALALQKKRPTFADLETAADLSIARALYDVASAQIHAGADGLRAIGLLGEEDSLPAGWSNAGLEDPGRHTVESVVLLVLASMRFRPTVARLISVGVLTELAHSCQTAFADGAERLSAAERTHA